MTAGSEWAGIRESFQLLQVILGHILAAALVLAGGVLLHYLLVVMGDPMLYDVVPWRYVVDTSDLAIFVGLVVVMLIIMFGKGSETDV